MEEKKMAKTKKKNRRVFISDIHLMDERSMSVQPGYNHPYNWTSQKRIDLLARFLEEQVIEREDVKELIILGDFLDNWVCPKDLIPATFQQIIDSGHNEKVMTNLRKIASPDVDVAVSYVPGNHDLTVEKAVMETNFPGIRVWGDGDKKYVGVYRAEGIAGEHGNQYNFFCAPNPDPENHGGHILPIGFFTSRFGAEKKALEGGIPDFWDILDFFLKDLDRSEPGFVKNLLLAVGKECGLVENSEIRMGGMDNFGESITLREVAELYADTMQRWNRVKPNDLSAAAAISNQLAGLRGTACRSHFIPGKARVGVFGHTHDEKLLGLNMNNSGMYCNTFDQNGCDYLYANAGTWTDKYECTFIETWISRGTRHFVGMYEYKRNGKRKRKKQRYIYLV